MTRDSLKEGAAPRTEAGYAMLMGDAVAGSYQIGHLDTCIWWKVGGQCDCGVLPAILAIEQEAARPLPEPQPLSRAASHVIQAWHRDIDGLGEVPNLHRAITELDAALGALPDRPEPSPTFNEDDAAVLREALAIGHISWDGDGWYAEQAGYSWERAEEILKHASVILSRLSQPPDPAIAHEVTSE